MDPQINPSIDLKQLPRHVAIIMDGNGRWAKRRLLPRIVGHREGVKAVDRVVAHARRMGIKALTLYSFSLENWSRPREEVDALMGILSEYLQKELQRMLREDIRFNAIGHLDDLPPAAREMVDRTMAETADRQGMVLTLALSYGSRLELKLRHFAPTPPQQARLWALVVICIIFVGGILGAGSGYGMIWLAAFTIAIGAAGTAIDRWRRKRSEVRELYAVVQRALGPVVRPEIDAPYRKGALPGAERTTTRS